MTNNTSTFRSFAIGQIVATHGALDKPGRLFLIQPLDILGVRF